MGEVRWIDDGFRGLLPFPFNSTLGGTSAAPPYFNDKNKASDGQYVIKFRILSLSLSPPSPPPHTHTETRNAIVYVQVVVLQVLTSSFIFSSVLQLQDIEKCTFLVELQLQRPFLSRGSDLTTWEVHHPLALFLSMCTKSMHQCIRKQTQKERGIFLTGNFCFTGGCSITLSG